eukprot:sb/3479761/
MILLLLTLLAASGTFAAISQDRTFYYGQNTFAKYRSWALDSQGIMMMQFKTFSKNALLYYSDGGPGSSDFLKIQLANERIIVQTDFGSGRVSFDIGSGLSDGQFHKIRVQVFPSRMVVYLDDNWNKEQSFDIGAADSTLILTSNSYIGGVPTYNTETLVEPDLALEPRFTGCIRNFQSTRRGDTERLALNMIVEEQGGLDGVGQVKCDQVSQGESCRNGGTCLSLVVGIVCECAGTGYLGTKRTRE